MSIQQVRQAHCKQAQGTRLIVWAVVIVFIAFILLVKQFTNFGQIEVQWNEAAAYGVILLIAGGFYELWQWLKRRSGAYRLAFGVGLVTAFFLFWVNGAVGIIGNEGQPANLLYGAVFAVGLIGSILARFKPRGMARTLFTAAVIQLLVPVAALLIWSQISWGAAGVTKTFVLNAIFALLFATSGLLFRRASAGVSHVD